MGTESVTIGAYQLAIDTTNGGIAGLRRDDGPDAIQVGAGGPSVLSLDVAHQPFHAVPVYKSHKLEHGTLTIVMKLGDLRLHDTITSVDGVLERRVVVENASNHEIQLTGLRVGFAGVAPGDPADCTFEAPANTLTPRQPLAAVVNRPAPVKAGPDWITEPRGSRFAPGAAYNWGRALGDAPDIGPGLLAVRNNTIDWTFIAWYFSRVEAAQPFVSGNGRTASLGFNLWLAGWLAPGGTLTSGPVQFGMVPGTLADAYAVYREGLTRAGVTAPIYGKLGTAQDWNALYEVHPGQFGGFNGLRRELRRIQQMGIDTLYLMPIHPHRNKRDAAWDENWDGVGSPYAILDFEAIDDTIGGAPALHELVETAHALGMRVLVDLVLQGSALEAKYVEEHPEWYARDEQGNMMHSQGWNDTWSFDWANPDYQKFVRGYAAWLVKEFDIDGFRVDAPHGKEPNWSREIAYHASATNLGSVKLLEDLRRDLLTIKPEAALYCELFGPLWAISHEISNDYHPYGMAYALADSVISTSEFNEYLRDYWAVMPPEYPRVCFTETHDTRADPAYAWRGSLISRAMLAMLVAGGFTPMVFAGQEDVQYDFLSGLLGARRTSAALRRGRHHFNAVTVDASTHYRAGEQPAPAERCWTHLRSDETSVVFAVVSLFPERVTYRFGLPLADLPIDPEARYRLRDLITNEYFDEYGREIWVGAELASFALTPKKFTPYLFRLEKVTED